MPRFPLHAASGTGVYLECRKKVIRFVRYGCANRPFFHIVVMPPKVEQRKPPIEQLGTYDPMPNKFNEKLVALNTERIMFWLGQGNVEISEPVEELLGIAGFLPIHPRTYIAAWRARRKAEEEAAKAKQEEDETPQTQEQSN
ncbi:probable 28S ribosomal protein S16, mitochondrial [Diachasma alloeum]|uniref:probable 28S ribosomal protein S16, mitochondrial n=1 Tax=Diachasma alloeum TaxID=454923 RepID=UPI0007381722|nr:probable 28S ribosomal protein S16, mitochondrial [Diachasma alloeum]